MSLNDELLSLDKRIKYFSLETFDDVPSDPGIYAWFYPLRIIGTDISRLIDEINFVFNFNHDSASNKTSRVATSLGWRDYALETNFKKLPEVCSLFSAWDAYMDKYSSTDELIEESEEVNELKRIIFISSVFLPPLYIGKTNDLHRRCFEHILGTGDSSNVFHNRFKKYVRHNENVNCKEVEELIFACISTKHFTSLPENNEVLVEQILMNLIKPIFSLK